MRLNEFIQANHKTIIEEWVGFARTLRPWSQGMSDKGLRDHAEELLTAVVSDMKAPQTTRQRSEKSKGNAVDGELAAIGQKHASDRLETGLQLNQLVSEYRALRASVLRLWEESQGDKQGEVTRFNEAIDETLATSLDRYTGTVEATREQFLGILGHDLRNPLGAITMGATMLADSDDPDNVEIATSILNSGNRMNRMVNDLLDLTRTRLETGIPVTPNPMDITAVCRQVISEFQATHPGCQLQFRSSGDLGGDWDSDRIAQVISNLVGNAVNYGTPAEPVSIFAEGHGDEVEIRVHNIGAPIPENALKTIFSPMVRHLHDGQNAKNPTGLGLGLYIANEIVSAHRGTIEVNSTEKGGTTFTVKIPRHAALKTAPTDRLPLASDRQGLSAPH